MPQRLQGDSIRLYSAANIRGVAELDYSLCPSIMHTPPVAPSACHVG